MPRASIQQSVELGVKNDANSKLEGICDGGISQTHRSPGSTGNIAACASSTQDIFHPWNADFRPENFGDIQPPLAIILLVQIRSS